MHLAMQSVPSVLVGEELAFHGRSDLLRAELIQIGWGVGEGDVVVGQALKARCCLEDAIDLSAFIVFRKWGVLIGGRRSSVRLEDFVALESVEEVVS